MIAFIQFIIFALSYAQINLANCPVATSEQIIAPPTLGDPLATLQNDIFTFDWIWSLTQTRTQSPSYQFGTCTPVSAPDSSSATGSCTLAQSGAIAWSTLAANCGWTNSSNAGFLTYSGSIFLSGNETFLDRRGNTVTRTVVFEFSLSVQFPENVTISSNITAFAPVLVDDFILKQVYDTNTNTGIVNFQTVVQYPWSIQLTGVTPDNTNGASVTSDLSNPGTIATSLSELSSQNWILSISPASGVCVLDGVYNVSADLVCTLSDQTLCPVLSASSTFNFLLSITSQNFCPQTSLDVPLVGIFNVYSDSGLTTQNSNFVENAESYYQLTITSPSATITNIDINQVMLTSNSSVINNGGTATSSLALFDAVNGGWIATTFPSSLSSSTNNGGVQSFNFNLTGNLLIIPADSAVDLTISARASVSFLGNKKRASLYTFQISRLSKSYKTSITYSSSSTTTTPPPDFSSSSFTSPNFALVVALLIVLIFSF